MTERNETEGSGSLHEPAQRRYATSYVLTQQAGWGELTITHAMSYCSAVSEDEARGIALRDAMDKYPSAKLQSILVGEVSSPSR